MSPTRERRARRVHPLLFARAVVGLLAGVGRDPARAELLFAPAAATTPATTRAPRP